MALNKRTRSNLAMFNHINSSPSRRLYNAKRIFLNTPNPIDKYVDSYKAVKDDTSNSKARELVRSEIPGEVISIPTGLAEDSGTTA